MGVESDLFGDVDVGGAFFEDVFTHNIHCVAGVKTGWPSWSSVAEMKSAMVWHVPLAGLSFFPPFRVLTSFHFLTPNPKSTTDLWQEMTAAATRSCFRRC